MTSTFPLLTDTFSAEGTEGLTEASIRQVLGLSPRGEATDETPDLAELMRPTGLSAIGGEDVAGTVNGTQVRYTNANQYERKTVAYARNPRSVTNVDGSLEWLGTYVENGVKREPNDGRKGRAGRKASCDCGTCKPCAERKRKADYRARVAEEEQARLKVQALTKVYDRLASRSFA